MYFREVRLASFRKLLQSKEEELIQRKRKTTTEESGDRKPKRRRQSKESSEGFVSSEDLSAVSTEHLQTLSEVSEQSEDVIPEEKDQTEGTSQDDNSKEVAAKIKREKERRNLEMRIEVCESCGSREGQTVPCNKCRLVYHLECIKETSEIVPNAESFVCPTCNPSTNPCFLCRQIEGEMVSCNFKLCGRRYHWNCLKVFHSPSVKQERPASQFFCPAHYCHTCVAELNELHQPEKKLVRCIHCPTAYHQSNIILIFVIFKLNFSYIFTIK